MAGAALVADFLEVDGVDHALVAEQACGDVGAGRIRWDDEQGRVGLGGPQGEVPLPCRGKPGSEVLVILLDRGVDDGTVGVDGRDHARRDVTVVAVGDTGRVRHRRQGTGDRFAAGETVGGGAGGPFCRVVRVAHLHRRPGRPGRGPARLHHVRQLMGQQPPASRAVRHKLPGTEVDVRPEREGTRIQRRGGVRGARVCVEAYAPQVRAERVVVA